MALGSFAACNQILGIKDISGGSSVDASSADAAMDASPFDCPKAAADEVIGCAVVTHVRADGTTFQTKKDLSTFDVAAYVTDASSPSGFRIINGTTGDGILHVENVDPGASFFLRVHDPSTTSSWPHYFYTDKRDLDLGTIEMGRDDTPATADTEVTVNLTGMQAFDPLTDFAGLGSFNSGTELGLDVSGTAKGATALNVTNDWRGGDGERTFADYIADATRPAQLVDQGASHGDDLWAMHGTNLTISDNAKRPVLVSKVIDVAPLIGATMTNGTPVTLTGAFQPALASPTPMTLSFNAAVVRESVKDGGRNYDESTSCTLAVSQAATAGLLLNTMTVLSISFTAQVLTDPAGSVIVPYANPLPSTWPQVMACSTQHIRFLKVPSGGNDSSSGSYVVSYTAGTNNLIWNPQIHGVTNIKVGTADGISGGAVAFDGVAPVTITWDAIPGVSHYQVRVKDDTLKSFPAQFDTSQATVSMPADTFVKGHFYVFRIFAIQTSGDYAGGHLLQYKVPLWSSRVSTGLLRLSKDCGNGTVETGEDCDPGPGGASTAACDADCSTVECGDGFFNAVAEQCDDGTDSQLCNGGTCKTSKCGDGYWNPLSGEECDDANLANGDGCSSLCKLEHCGDGVVTAGLEGCDDNNRISGDGCDAFCQPEFGWNCVGTAPSVCTRQ